METKDCRCDVCDLDFVYFSGLQRHKRTKKHAILAAIKELDQELDQSSQESSEQVVVSSCSYTLLLIHITHS